MNSSTDHLLEQADCRIAELQSIIEGNTAKYDYILTWYYGSIKLYQLRVASTGSTDIEVMLHNLNAVCKDRYRVEGTIEVSRFATEE